MTPCGATRPQYVNMPSYLLEIRRLLRHTEHCPAFPKQSDVFAVTRHTEHCPAFPKQSDVFAVTFMVPHLPNFISFRDCIATVCRLYRTGDQGPVLPKHCKHTPKHFECYYFCGLKYMKCVKMCMFIFGTCAKLLPSNTIYNFQQVAEQFYFWNFVFLDKH